jgi:hypothetical protein
MKPKSKEILKEAKSIETRLRNIEGIVGLEAIQEAKATPFSEEYFVGICDLAALMRELVQTESK